MNQMEIGKAYVIADLFVPPSRRVGMRRGGLL